MPWDKKTIITVAFMKIANFKKLDLLLRSRIYEPKPTRPRTGPENFEIFKTKLDQDQEIFNTFGRTRTQNNLEI